MHLVDEFEFLSPIPHFKLESVKITLFSIQSFLIYRGKKKLEKALAQTKDEASILNEKLLILHQGTLFILNSGNTWMIWFNDISAKCSR